MKTILITGGAGFIGSNFIKHILETYNSYNIINLDVLTYAANLDNLKTVMSHPQYTFVKGDITDTDLVKQLLQTYDVNYIINFAAESHVDNSILAPEKFITTNINGTMTLLNAAKEYWTIGKDDCGYPIYKEDVKFLQISTDEVYGSLGRTGLFTEESSIAPNSPYSASKASADLLVRSYGETYHLPVNITRCSNNYGQNQLKEKLIPLMISKANNDERLPVYGDGMQVRDWLHVKDHCRGIDLVMHNGVDREVYNIGGNCEKTNLEIIRRILEELDKPEELIEYVQDRLGHDKRYAIDSTKIKRELGWKPEVTFEEGISETIKWYLENQDRL